MNGAPNRCVCNEICAVIVNVAVPWLVIPKRTEDDMAEKSKQKPNAKKVGKTLLEKRAEKKLKKSGS